MSLQCACGNLCVPRTLASRAPLADALAAHTRCLCTQVFDRAHSDWQLWHASMDSNRLEAAGTFEALRRKGVPLSQIFCFDEQDTCYQRISSEDELRRALRTWSGSEAIYQVDGISPRDNPEASIAQRVACFCPEYLLDARREAVLSAGLVDKNGKQLDVATGFLHPDNYFDERGNFRLKAAPGSAQSDFGVYASDTTTTPFGTPLPRPLTPP